MNKTSENFGIWAQYKVDIKFPVTPPDGGVITKVYHSGFVL